MLIDKSLRKVKACCSYTQYKSFTTYILLYTTVYVLYKFASQTV